MKGAYEICVKNARLQYKFTVNRNITVLRGDSATGKTTLIEMIDAYLKNGKSSGVSVICEKQCVVLSSYNWELNLKAIKDSIVFIDEGEKFIASTDFSKAVKESDNYYVLATRNRLVNLPYSVNEIYGIKNKSGNRYQGTKRLFSEFYPLYEEALKGEEKPCLAIVEDSNAGYEFFRHYFNKHNIECVSANGKSNISEKIISSKEEQILIIADGAAFGSEIEAVLKLRKIKSIAVYLPESFEWMILRSGLFSDKETREILKNPSEYIDSRVYLSWERFFSEYLTKISQETYLRYNKKELNEKYLQENECGKIIAVMPSMKTE